MRYALPFILVLSLLAPDPAVARPERGMTVTDLGQDGHIRYYDVRCSSTVHVIMEQTVKEGTTCFRKADESLQCFKTLDLDAVAARACEGRQKN